MEIGFKKWKIKMKCEEDPTRNKKWGILKYLSAEISFEKSAIIRRQTARVSGALCQKLGYDRCLYLSFFVQRFEDEIFDSTGRRDLNTKYTIFDLRCYECLWCNMNAGRRRHFDWDDKSQWDTWICWERDPTPLGDSVVLLGKMVVYFCIGMEWRDTFWPDRLGMTLERMTGKLRMSIV